MCQPSSRSENMKKIVVNENSGRFVFAFRKRKRSDIDKFFEWTGPNQYMSNSRRSQILTDKKK